LSGISMVGSFIFKRPDVFNNWLNQRISEDVDAQKSDIANEKEGVQEDMKANEEKWGHAVDQKQADRLSAAEQFKWTELQLDGLSKKYSGPEEQARIDMMKGVVQQNYQKQMDAYQDDVYGSKLAQQRAQQSAAAAAAGASQKQAGEARKTLQALLLKNTPYEKAVNMTARMYGVDPKTFGAENQEGELGSAVPPKEGKGGAAGGPTGRAAASLITQAAALKEAIGIIDKEIDLPNSGLGMLDMRKVSATHMTELNDAFPRAFSGTTSDTQIKMYQKTLPYSLYSIRQLNPMEGKRVTQLRQLKADLTEKHQALQEAINKGPGNAPLNEDKTEKDDADELGLKKEN
jgi:hypothetical protein